MPRSVVVLRQPTNRRSHIVCDAMFEGIRRVEGAVTSVSLVMSPQYVCPMHDVAVFYGLNGRLTGCMTDYCRAEGRRAVYIDLGYFGRREGGKLVGYHKLAVDARHPTAYFQNKRHSNGRFKRFGYKIAPWRESSPTSHILIAGMGPKGAAAEGYHPGQWESEAVRIIRRHTKRPIIYRPKPNWAGALPIPGAQFTKPDSIKLELQLAGAHAVVSHHSNTNVEGLLHGIPSFTEGGIAVGMGLSDLSQIENPVLPDGRDQWLNDLAWVQWTVAEMRDGLAWRYLRDEGLV